MYAALLRRTTSNPDGSRLYGVRAQLQCGHFQISQGGWGEAFAGSSHGILICPPHGSRVYSRPEQAVWIVIFPPEERTGRTRQKGRGTPRRASPLLIPLPFTKSLRRGPFSGPKKETASAIGKSGPPQTAAMRAAGKGTGDLPPRGQRARCRNVTTFPSFFCVCSGM